MACYLFLSENELIGQEKPISSQVFHKYQHQHSYTICKFVKICENSCGNFGLIPSPIWLYRIDFYPHVTCTKQPYRNNISIHTYV